MFNKLKKNSKSMRTIILITLLSMVYASSKSQENKAIPPDVVDAFSMLYPVVKDVTWKNKAVDFEANFEQNEKMVSLLFDKNGNLKEVESQINKSDLPVDVSTMLANRYADWNILKVARVNISGTSRYKAEIGKEDQMLELIFNMQGTILKESRE